MDRDNFKVTNAPKRIAKLNQSQSETEMKILRPAVRLKLNIGIGKNRGVYFDIVWTQEKTKKQVGWSFSLENNSHLTLNWTVGKTERFKYIIHY